MPKAYALYLAEREGFEPSVRYHRTHDFQSCSLSRSDTSPSEYLISINYTAHYVKHFFPPENAVTICNLPPREERSHE